MTAPVRAGKSSHTRTGAIRFFVPAFAGQGYHGARAGRRRHVLALVRFLVALEMLLLPLWAAAMCVRPALLKSEISNLQSAGSRLWHASWAVLLMAAATLALAALAEEPAVAGALESQAVAMGFLVLLAGVAGAIDRTVGPRAAQIATTLIGWLLLAGIILVGPAAELMQGAAQGAIIRFAAHANPLVVAERALGLDWLHQGLTYRLTPLGESYGYLLGDLAWWKTALGHFFVGSGLLVFGAAGLRRPEAQK
jgi:hypothetical protein